MPGVSPEVARWIRQLKAQPGVVRRLATGLAGRIHPRAPLWLPGFLQVSRVERRNLVAAHHLLTIGPELRPAVPQLVAVFADRQPSIGFYAYMALTYSGVPAEEVVARLRQKPGAEPWDVPFYASLLATEDERVREFSWACLEATGTEAAGAESRLQELATEGDPALRERARRLLGEIGRPMKPPRESGP